MTQHPAALADCLAPLDEEEASALHAYWDRVMAEVWGTSRANAPMGRAAA